jgi:ribonuclease HI
MAREVIIYCDGACLGNPGPGGYAALLMRFFNDPEEKAICGKELSTTNNRMELRAAIEGLKAINKSCKVKIFCDSQYVVKGMTEWIQAWQKSHFKNAKNKQIKNLDLWQELLTVSLKHEVAWHWVKGHANNPYNDRVDEIAREQALLAMHQAKIC